MRQAERIQEALLAKGAVHAALRLSWLLLSWEQLGQDEAAYALICWLQTGSFCERADAPDIETR